MELIRVEDLKRWRANRIQSGCCSFDDMQALGAFIEQVEKIDRPQGKWVWNQYDANPNIGNYHCSRCRWLTPHDKYAYCPNCGARMVEDEQMD